MFSFEGIILYNAFYIIIILLSFFLKIFKTSKNENDKISL